jgi:hypothetical protein
MAANVLQEELRFYDEQKAELLRTHPGQFVVIKGRKIFGIFPTRAEAYGEGVRRFVREPFLIKAILEHENPEQVPLLANSIQRADI